MAIWQGTRTKVTASPSSVEDADLQALIEEAWQRTRRRRRRQRIVVLSALGLLTALVAGAVALFGSGTSDHSHRARSVSAWSQHATQRVLYTRALLAPPEPASAGAASATMIIENWVSTDGTWRLRETIPGRAPGSIDVVVHGDGLLPPQANATAAFGGVPVNLRNPGDGLFTAAELASLPLTTVALTARLEREVTAEELRNLDAYVLPGPRRAADIVRLRPVFLGMHTRDLLVAIADLDLAPLPPRLAPALYRVARSVPGVRVTAGSDQLGHATVQVAGGGVSLGFDPRTGALRASSPGTFFDQGVAGTIVAQGDVPGLDALPHGVAHVRSLVPPPPPISLTPAAGGRTTTFTLGLVVPHDAAAQPRAPALAAEMFGPTGPNCVFWVSRPPMTRIPPGTIVRRHNQTLASYRVSPNTIGRPDWCPGRYQLMVTPLSPPPVRAFTPRSFAAAYFQVR